MIVAGLTGSIAMGKSETARMFAAQGIPVFDSDAAVHALYEKGGDAVAAIGSIVPSAIIQGGVDRQKLAAMIQAQPSLLPRIESAVHPLVQKMQARFLADAAAAGSDMALLDVPLLFETGREKDVDVVIVVSAGERLQRERALSRSGMTAEKFDFILSRQMPDEQKRAQADYVIDTSSSLADTAREVERVIADIRAKSRQ
jgi:dephospho-CoA kinase